MEYTLNYQQYKITCEYLYLEAKEYSGYYWITTSSIPNWPLPILCTKLTELEKEVKLVIDRWN